MPPKPRLHNQTGKSSRNIPKVVASPVVTNQASSANPEPSTSNGLALNEQQFETELCWCIQQLQNALKSQKLNNKQVHEHTKSLNVLMNNTTPLVQKRQVMRLSFGDYRAKMQAEEKKAAKKISMKVMPAKPSEKSMFLKKAFSSIPGSDFKFNFSCVEDDSNNISDTMNQLNIVKEDPNQPRDSSVLSRENGVYKPSDNMFRFNFSVSE